MSLRNPDPVTHDLFIDGHWQASHTGETYDRLDPFDGSVISRYAQASDSEVQNAIRAAR